MTRHIGQHTIYSNLATDLHTAVPRHREIHRDMADKVREDLGVVAPGETADEPGE